MNFNFDNERPIYIQLVESLRTSIISGFYQLGSKLPSVRELALMAKVNPNTMQKALSELEEDNLIYTERTNGKYVTTDKKLIEKIKNNLAKEKTKSFINDMNKIGVAPKEIITYLEELGGK